jgi:hypothetical protein
VQFAAGPNHLSVPRAILIAGTLILLTALAAGLVLYLAYAVDTDPPGEARITALDSPSAVTWTDHGSVHIDARSMDDFVSSLGYAHGMNRTWITLLARQIALGRLSEWMGSEATDVDVLASRLDFAGRGQAAFDALPADVRHRYERYANGLNAALETPRLRRLPALVLLEIDPEPWEAWHSLAVERLWSWMAAPVQLLPDTTAGAATMLSADRALRSRLHVYGMQNNMLLVVGGGARIRHLFRYVTGDSGQPIFQEFEYANGSEPILDGLSLPGSIAIPAGRTADMSWAYLFSSDVSVRSRPANTDAEHTSAYSRVTDRAGSEEVVLVERLDDELVLAAPRPGDSTYTVLSWAGLGETADATGWSGLLDGRLPAFSIIREEGLIIDSTGTPHVVGSPRTAFSHASGVRLVTNSESGEALVSRLRLIIAGQTDVQSDWDLLHDTYSEAASGWNDVFLAGADSFGIASAVESGAVEYLRNWDHSYRGSSIAASILENARAFLPPAPPDSLRVETYGAALTASVESLVERFGSDMREWRWETVQELAIYFPGWSAPLEDDDHRVRQFKNEFLPVSVASRGHPTTLAWGPTVGRSWRPAGAAWEGLFGHAPGSEFEFERPIVSYSTFLGRFLAESRTPVDVRTDVTDAAERRTLLQPAT